MAAEETETSEVPSLLLLTARFIFTVLILLYGAVLVHLIGTYFNPARHPVLTGLVITTLGTIFIAVSFWFLSGWLSSRVRIALFSIVFMVTVLLPLTAVWPGSITYGEFGFTIVGYQPVPYLDIKIPAGGAPWVHYKDHTFHANEIRSVSTNAKVVVIGTGWQGAARVPDDAVAKTDVRLIVQPTDEAIKTYNKLLRKNVPVSLLIHTTC